MPVAAGFLIVGAALVGIMVLLGKGASSASAAQTAVNTSAQASSGLTAGASGKLGANQAAFASRLAQDTGLDPDVVAAWVLSEEPASSKQAPNGANNWLNIGATDSGYYGAGNPAWATPTQAADFTAAWLQGATDPGFGSASAGIRNILSTVGTDASTQIKAIQSSGWASSGYPGLPSVYAGLAG